jgi:zinc finger protein
MTFCALLNIAVPHNKRWKKYLQNVYAPDPDPNMTTEDYERTWDQNEAYGLNDIHVDQTGDFIPEESEENEDA